MEPYYIGKKAYCAGPRRKVLQTKEKQKSFSKTVVLKSFWKKKLN
jgi:hypothetical protein